MPIFENKTVVITGGTGSLGKTVVNRILSGEMGTPKKVIVFSRDEAKQHDMRMSYQHKLVATDEVIYRNFLNVLEFRIGDIRNYADVCAAVKDANIVVNAAALKQVPVCEYFPYQAVLTNCLGVANIVRAIEENRYQVETVIAISTDKACKPVNVMGMTKSIQERIVIAANILNPETRFICVRYGNVLASRGSVIPLFHDQIKNGGPVTVTVPEMTRFLISLNQAVDTVFAAIAEAKRGETYVPNAPSSKVIDIAKALIGKQNIEIKITGIRPGEKMHEIMVSEEEANHCVKRGEYFAILPMLPELRENGADIPNTLSKEFSSADTILDLEGTKELLIKHNLIVSDGNSFSKTELLR
ncbi:MAG: polysaccharide biosynthesis protein [Pseudomonadota bacterium]